MLWNYGMLYCYNFIQEVLKKMITMEEVQRELSSLRDRVSALRRHL
jgi:hypothetical protein